MSPSRAVVIGCSSLLAGALGTGVLLADASRWDPALFAAILLLVVCTDLLIIDLPRMQVSASFLGFLLAMVLLGRRPQR